MSDSSDEHSLAGQNITSVPSDFIAEHGEKCTKLDLSGNRIQYVPNTPSLVDYTLEISSYDAVCSLCHI